MDKITALKILLNIAKTLANEKPDYFNPILREIPPVELMMFPIEEVEKEYNPLTGKKEYPEGYRDEDEKNKDSEDKKDVNEGKKDFENAKDENKEKKDFKDAEDVKNQDIIISTDSEKKKEELKKENQDNDISTNSKNNKDNKDDFEEDEEDIINFDKSKYINITEEPKEIYHIGISEDKKKGKGDSKPFIRFKPVYENQKLRNVFYDHIKAEMEDDKLIRYVGYIKKDAHMGYLDMTLNLLFKYIIEDLPVIGVNVNWYIVTFYFKKASDMLSTAGFFMDLGGEKNHMAIDVHMKSKSFRLILGCNPHSGVVEQYDANNNNHANAKAVVLPENKYRDINPITKECLVMDNYPPLDEGTWRRDRFKENAMIIFNDSVEFIRRKAISVKRTVNNLLEMGYDALEFIGGHLPDLPDWLS